MNIHVSLYAFHFYDVNYIIHPINILSLLCFILSDNIYLWFSSASSWPTDKFLYELLQPHSCLTPYGTQPR